MSRRSCLVLLVLVATLVYLNALRNGFVFDDGLYVLKNDAVTKLSIAQLFQVNKYTNVFRPLTFATFALNWIVSGAHPFTFHLVNLLLHAAVTAVFYLLLLRLLEPSPSTPLIAFVAALLFAVHPLHTEAVASIVGRSELLAAGLLFGAWILHLDDRPILALACYVLALLSKEPAVVYFPLVVVGDYARRQFKPLARYGWAGIVTIVYLASLWKIQGGRFGPTDISFLDNPLARLPAKLRILNAFRLAWKYIGLHFYPGDLSCDYSYNSILLYSTWRHNLPWVFMALLVIALWIWTLWVRKTNWALAGTIYLIGFSVTANVLVPGGTLLGERLAYVPSAGFCLLISLLWIQVEKRYKEVAWGLLIAIVATMSVRTIVRNRDWKDDFGLYSAAVRVVPRSAKMHADLGAEYMYRNESELARLEFETALRIYPDFPAAKEWYGLLQAAEGHDEEALRLLREALSETATGSVNYDFSVVNLAAQLMKMDRNDEASVLLDRVIVASPDFPRGWANRAVIHLKRGEIEAARSDAVSALRMDPNNSQALNVLKLLSSAERREPTREDIK